MKYPIDEGCLKMLCPPTEGISNDDGSKDTHEESIASDSVKHEDVKKDKKSEHFYDERTSKGIYLSKRHIATTPEPRV